MNYTIFVNLPVQRLQFMYPPLPHNHIIFFTLISDSLQTILCDDGSENQGDLLYLLLQVQYCTVRHNGDWETEPNVVGIYSI
jgi:hypothetical protein